MQALALDDTLAEAHTVLASLLFSCDWNWTAAEREFQRALELNPGYATAHVRYALYLRAMGRAEEGRREEERSREMDPVSLFLNPEKALEMDPNYARAHISSGRSYERKRMFKEAIAEFQKAMALSERSPEVLADLGYLYAAAGQRDEALRVLNELRALAQHRYVLPYYPAVIYAGLGEKDLAFLWLEKAYTERAGQLAQLKMTPRFDRLRADPRFADLVRRVGLP